MLTGFVGREEMMLSIDSRRSGYISARRISSSERRLGVSGIFSDHKVGKVRIQRSLSVRSALRLTGIRDWGEITHPHSRNR